MRFPDIFKIALHNLRYNLSRTVLTVAIVTIVSTLMMTICLFGTTFYTNYLDLNELLFKLNGTTYTLYGKNDDGKARRDNDVSEEELDALTQTAQKYRHVVDSLRIDAQMSSSDGSQYIFWGDVGVPQNEFEVDDWLKNDYVGFSMDKAEFACFELYDVRTEGFFYEGRSWTPADEGGNGVWLSTETVRKLEEKGVRVKVGDTLTLAYLLTSFIDFEAESGLFTLEGIYFAEAGAGFDNVQNSTPSLIVSARSMKKIFGEHFEMTAVSMRYNPPDADYIFNDVYSSMEQFTKEVNEKIPPNIRKDVEYERFVCSFVQEMKTVMIVGGLVLGVVVLLALIILLLSVGSVANTVVISVDKDRKFIGLMKALGLKQKGVVKIVTCQSLCMVVAGVAISVGLLFLAKSTVRSVIDSIITAIAGMALPVPISLSVPVLLPLVTALAFFGTALLFSRGSLKKIAKQDVIGTINEVA